MGALGRGLLTGGIYVFFILCPLKIEVSFALQGERERERVFVIWQCKSTSSLPERERYLLAKKEVLKKKWTFIHRDCSPGTAGTVTAAREPLAP